MEGGVLGWVGGGVAAQPVVDTKYGARLSFLTERAFCFAAQVFTDTLAFALRDAGAEILRDDVKQRNEITQDDAPAGSFKVADPDGNVVDVTDNLHEWRFAR